MPSKAVSDLTSALAYLRREKRRCERRLAELRGDLAAADADAAAQAARQDRSTAGWTDEKRLAVSHRMRAYWAARRGGCDEAGPSAGHNNSTLLTARNREPMPAQPTSR